MSVDFIRIGFTQLKKKQLLSLEHLPRKETNLQNKSLEGQYIKQWHQNIFDKETKVKENKQRLKYFLDAGRFFFFLSSFRPLVYKTITNKRAKQTKKKQNQVIYSAYIYIKAFLLGRKTVDLIQPPLLHNQINSQIYHDTLQCYIIFMLPAVNEQIQLEAQATSHHQHGHSSVYESTGSHFPSSLS